MRSTTRITDITSEVRIPQPRSEESTHSSISMLAWLVSLPGLPARSYSMVGTVVSDSDSRSLSDRKRLKSSSGRPRGRPDLCAEHVRELGGERTLLNLVG